MAGNGPAPTPTAILKLRGSGNARGRKGEPEPLPGRPKVPKFLDPDSKRLWKRIAAQLEGMNVLTAADESALMRYARFLSRWIAAERKLIEHGDTFEDDKGNSVARPEVRISNDMHDRLLRLEQQFGLTPSARTRIRAEHAPEKKRDGDKKSKGRFFAGGGAA